MFFRNRNVHKTLKFSDKVALENFILISKTLYKILPKVLCDWFTLSFESIIPYEKTMFV